MAKKLDAERIEQARHKGEKTNNRREDQMFFDMTAAQEFNFRNNVAKDE